MGYTDVHPLVAFSGTVKYQGEEYTESDLNGAVLDEGYDDEFDM